MFLLQPAVAVPNHCLVIELVASVGIAIHDPYVFNYIQFAIWKPIVGEMPPFVKLLQKYREGNV